jgi:hypothetical protein
MLGTHTFFMVFLPIFFFFGDAETGRGCVAGNNVLFTPLTIHTSLINVSAFGVYSTSFLKDFACSPRPYAPPVTRLSAFAVVRCRLVHC